MKKKKKKAKRRTSSKSKTGNGRLDIPINFSTTADIEVPKRTIDQVIGQDKGVEIVEKAAKQRRNILLLGPPGCGKSMLAQGMAEIMPAENLEDALVYPNPLDENNPKVRVVKTYPKGLPAENAKPEEKIGQGRKILFGQRMQKGKGRSSLSFIWIFVILIAAILILQGAGSVDLESFDFEKYGTVIAAVVLGGLILIAMWMFTSKIGAGLMKREQMAEPKLIVDNTGKRTAPFVEATGAKAGSLFGDVRHDPLQCIPGGELVHLPDGKPVNVSTLLDPFFENKKEITLQLKGPDQLEVLAGYDKEYGFICSKVSNVFRRYYEGNIIEVKTRRGYKIRVTPNHPLAIFEKEGKINYIRADKLLKGIYVTVPDKLPIAVNKNYAYDQIVEIKKIPYSGYVYNMTTETGNYLVNNILTHNSGGLGTPPHLRVEAGAIHRSNKGVLYVDEIGTLSPRSQQDLLYAMQEKKFPITGQSEMSSGALTRTEPVPCDFVLVAAGNLHVLQNMHPALRSRIRGYGYEIYLNDTIDDTAENRAKFARFVAQEVKKDEKIPHFTREAVKEIIMEARKRAGRKGKLTIKLRELGGLIRAAGDIAKEENAPVADVQHIHKALGIAQTAEQQLAKQLIGLEKEYSVLINEGDEVGRVNGLAVLGETYSGLVMPIAAEVTPASSKYEGKVIATGKLGEIAKEAVQNVSAIIKKYMKKDVASYDMHIQFLQTYEGGVEGDSASISVALAVLSAMEKIPVMQSVSTTGSLSVRGEVLPVGGVTAKIEAAIASGIKTVIIPRENADDIALPKETLAKVKIIPVDTIIDVMEAALKPGKKKNYLIRKLKKEFK